MTHCEDTATRHTRCHSSYYPDTGTFRRYTGTVPDSWRTYRPRSIHTEARRIPGGRCTWSCWGCSFLRSRNCIHPSMVVRRVTRNGNLWFLACKHIVQRCIRNRSDTGCSRVRFRSSDQTTPVDNDTRTHPAYRCRFHRFDTAVICTR